MKYNKIIEGDLVICSKTDLKINEVFEIKGNLILKTAIKISLPNCSSVGGTVEAYENAKISLPNCSSVGGWVEAYRNAKISLPNCSSVGGWVRAYKNAKISLPNCSSVGGTVEAYENAKISLPNCSSVGGWVRACENAKISLPNCSSVGGTVEAYENAKISLPNCSSVGGWVEAYKNAKIEINNDCKQNDDNCPAFKTRNFCLKFNFECFLKLGFLFADGILSKIIERKKNVFKIQIFGKTETSYCLMIENGDSELPTFSHGKTIKEAKESLIYKISNRDTSVYKSYKLDTVVSFEEAIKMYRTITGACEFGTRNFVQGLTKTKKKYKISEIIKITENQFGNETFREFFSKNQVF